MHWFDNFHNLLTVLLCMTNDTSSFWLINLTCTIVAKSSTRAITFYTIEGRIWIIPNEIGNEWFETASSINNYANITGQNLENKDFSNYKISLRKLLNSVSWFDLCLLWTMTLRKSQNGFCSMNWINVFRIIGTIF